MVSVKSVVPSTLKSTEATPTLTEAFAETVTAEPETVEPFTGAVMETVGEWCTLHHNGTCYYVYGIRASAAVCEAPRALVCSLCYGKMASWRAW